MTRQIDNEVLVGFIDEVKQYLPEITESIEAYWSNPSQIERLETAFRHIHTVKGASSMLGLKGLSHIANFYEECLEKLGTGSLSSSNYVYDFLKNAPHIIKIYLDHTVENTLTEQLEALMVSEVREAYQNIDVQVDHQEDDLEDDNNGPLDLELGLFEDDESTGEAKSAPTVEFEVPEVAVEPEEEMSLADIVAMELLEPFTIEAEEHLYHISLQLNELAHAPAEMQFLEEVRRRVHTLKGAAGTVGFVEISSLSHRMEDLLDILSQKSSPISSEIITLLFETADALEDLLNKRASAENVSNLYQRYDAILENIENPKEVHSQEVPSEEAQPESTLTLELFQDHEPQDLGQIPTPTPEPAKEAIAQPVIPTPLTPQEVVRVPLQQLDDLVRSVSELVITRASLEQYMGGMSRISTELLHSFERLRRLTSEIESQNKISSFSNLNRATLFAPANVPNRSLSQTSTLIDTDAFDPYQDEFDNLQMDRYSKMHLLNRELAETTNDLRTIHDELRHLSGDFDATLNRQRRLSGEIQDRLMRTRMVPLATLATQLHRVVRVVSQKKGKTARLILEGEHTELDKEVLEAITDPLFHILRNAVDHGLESAKERVALGKAEQGEIRLRTYHGGNQVIIEIEDDGGGINPEKLAKKGLEMNLISEEQLSKLTKQDITSLVFVPGFSTADELSEVSGRGVGLDVVKSSINKLKGSISIDSSPGKGTKFTIRLPLTLAIVRSLMVRSHEDTYAIPLGAVTQIMRIDHNRLEMIGEDQVLRINGEVYPMLYLDQLINSRAPAFEKQERIPVLIVDTGFQQIALAVDDILEGREIVVKTLGSHLKKVQGITGATLLGDGRVVLILNPAELGHEPVTTFNRFENQLLENASISKPLEVLIVDDSVSVRRVVSNLIKSTGWVPQTAKDGMEALEVLQKAGQLPDIILMDIEMPRMDGYELTAALQAHEMFKQIPIIMITSRASDKHRRKAFTLGVDDYMVKPFQDEVLLNRIRNLTRVKEAA